MTDDPSYFKQMAAQWRELAEIGDPARRLDRRRWAAALDLLAESQTESQNPVLSCEAEEKKS